MKTLVNGTILVVLIVQFFSGPVLPPVFLETHHWVERDFEKSHCYTISPQGSIKLILPLTSMMTNSEPHKCYRNRDH